MRLRVVARWRCAARVRRRSAQRGGARDGDLRDYARAHVGVVRRDDRRARPGCRPTSSTADGTHERPDVDHEHRRLHVERGRRPSGSGFISRARARDAAVADDRRRSSSMERYQRHAASTTTGTTTARARSSRAWPPRPEARVSPDPVLRRQRLARGRPEDRREQRPAAARGAPGALYEAMDFGFYYVPERQPRALPLPARTTPPRSPCCYDTVVSESRIVDYLGIGARAAARRRRTTGAGARSRTPATGPGRRRKPVGDVRARYFGVDVFEGAYRYARHRSVVPSWGGIMFEALMPALFVPEERWAPRSWGDEPPAHRPGADLPRPASRPATATGASRRRTSPEGGYGV